MSALAIHLAWIAAFAFALSLALAPIEALGWWAGWLGDGGDDGEARPTDARPAARAKSATPPSAFIVFLSGIGSISGDELLERETVFLDRLQGLLPGAVIVRDVFPYAPSGRPLMTGQRFFAWFWRRVRKWRSSGTLLLPAIVNLRNLFQVMVSADRRYGPIYSYAIARIITDRLAAHGYRAGSGVPLILLGSSGGAQIALGAAPYLRAAIGAPLNVVAIGGVMASDRGLDDVAHLISLHGDRDRIYNLGRIVFPGRWPIFIGSNWNGAQRERRLVERGIGTLRHSGAGGYLDTSARAGAPPAIDRTLRETRAAIEAILAATRGASPVHAPITAGS